MSPKKTPLHTQDMMLNIMMPSGLTLSEFQISTTLLVNSLKSLFEIILIFPLGKRSKEIEPKQKG
jgi:hypothetical protein